MTITYSSDGNLHLKTKNELVVLGSSVKIGSHTITGPGEYDVASIQCEGQALPTGVVYFIRSEDLLITFLPNCDEAVNTVDDASDTDILVFDVRSSSEADKAKAIIKALEPSYVFLLGSSSQEVSATLGLSTGEESSLKITQAGLPLEGTTLITNR